MLAAGALKTKIFFGVRKSDKIIDKRWWHMV